MKGTLTTDRLLRWSLKDFGYSRVLLIPRGGEYKSDKIARLLGYPQTGYFDFTVNNSGYSLQYNHFYLETYWDEGYFDYATQSLSSGDWTSVTMIIPHGTSLDPNTSWLKRVSYEYTYTKGRERDTNQVDISAYVSHVKYCTGGSWQSNSTQHWKQCGTCGYVGSGRVNHT